MTKPSAGGDHHAGLEIEPNESAGDCSIWITSDLSKVLYIERFPENSIAAIS